jgi:hypothetical protein
VYFTSEEVMKRRFTRPVFLWAMIASLTQLAVGHLVRTGSAPRVLLALPALPLLLFIVVMVRAVARMDELQRRICLESASIAFVLTLAIAFIFSGLASAGVFTEPWDVGTTAMALWVCAYIFSSRRYE